MIKSSDGGAKPANEILAIAELNARLQPLDRGDLYEDLLDEVVRSAGIGEITGGGTLMFETGEPARSDIELVLSDVDEATLRQVVEHLERLGAPKGSRLVWGDGEEAGCVREFGTSEGFAIYLNGTDLDAQVYEESDVNELISTMEEAVAGSGKFGSYWNGPEETALYFYGPSFDKIKSALAPIIERTPLCERSRVEQIA